MKRLIPPYLFFSLLLFAAAAALIAPAAAAIQVSRPMPWDVPLIIGVAALFLADREFTRHRAEIHTFKTPHSLVTTGIFRYSRNPMYLGFLLLLLGASLFAESWFAMIAPLGFFLASQFWYIPHEEAKLRTLFGAEYDAYAHETWRWFGRSRAPWQKTA